MRLTKHHGLGNDFLVLLDAEGTAPLTAERVRALCDRHRGVGADGLLRATPVEGAAAAMELRNADGSPAEMSGNGIRCLAQALLAAGWAAGPEVPIRTAAGLRRVTALERVDGATQSFAVDMGAVRLGDDAPEWAGGPVARARFVDVGNPHLVLELRDPHHDAAVSDTPAVSLVELGDRVEAKVPGGANVHLVAPTGDGGIVVRTYERGVGPTQACGTGACASAAAARAWGLVGDRVPVRMPGGAAEVVLGDVAVLRGPATAIAAVEVPPAGVAG